MKNLALFLFLFLVAVLAFAVIQQRQATARMREALRAVELRVADLAEEVSSLQQEQHRAAALADASEAKPDDTSRLTRLQEEVARLREELTQLARANAAISNEIASARGANIPFVYPDSTKRKDYAFAGFSTAQSALQSALWAITQMDAKTYLSCLTGRNAEMSAQQFQDLPDGVMPGGFRNGAMFKASGFRVLEETPLPNDEVHLRVFLEGSRTVIKPVFQKIGGEWKWSSNELP